jgi:hypothetical protein
VANIAEDGQQIMLGTFRNFGHLRRSGRRGEHYGSGKYRVAHRSMFLRSIRRIWRKWILEFLAGFGRRSRIVCVLVVADVLSHYRER